MKIYSRAAQFFTCSIFLLSLFPSRPPRTALSLSMTKHSILCINWIN